MPNEKGSTRSHSGKKEGRFSTHNGNKEKCFSWLLVAERRGPPPRKPGWGLRFNRRGRKHFTSIRESKEKVTESLIVWRRGGGGTSLLRKRKSEAPVIREGKGRTRCLVSQIGNRQHENPKAIEKEQEKMKKRN